MREKESGEAGDSSSFHPSWLGPGPGPCPAHRGSSPASWKEKEPVFLNARGIQEQAEENRAVTSPVTGEGNQYPLVPYHRSLGSGCAWGSHHAPVTL